MSDEGRPELPVAAAREPDAAARGALRASHTDRDDVVEQLRVAGGDGRLDATELDERVGAALTARTFGELAALISDLPSSELSGGAVVNAKEVVRIDLAGGNARREGPWLVPQQMEVRVSGGNVRLDFTEAAISRPVLLIDVDVVGGNFTLITRPGIVVDADEVAVLGGNIKVRTHGVVAAPVVLRVELRGKVAGGNVKARPPRRSFWDWLRGAPATSPPR
jgi:hypothetical protein